LEDGVARPRVDALDDEDVPAHQVRDAMGMADDHRVDGRVGQSVGDPQDRPDPGCADEVTDGVLTGVGSLVDDDDLDTYTVRAEALRFGLDPGRLVEELEAGRRARGDELRSVLQLCRADDERSTHDR